MIVTVTVLWLIGDGYNPVTAIAVTASIDLMAAEIYGKLPATANPCAAAAG